MKEQFPSAARQAPRNLGQAIQFMKMAEAELDAGGVNRTLKDLFAGAMGGIAQVLLGQYIYIILACVLRIQARLSAVKPPLSLWYTS